MPTTALFTNTNGNVTLSTSENYFLAEGVTHYRTTNGTVLTVGGLSDNDIVVNGSIAQIANGEAISVTTTGTSGVSITIGQTGSVFGSSNYRAINSVADRTLVANNGLLTGGETIILNGNNSQVMNTGTIQNIFSTNGFSAFAVQMTGIGATMYNSGVVDGLRGIKFSQGGDLTNTGTVTSTSTAIDFSLNSVTAVLFNTGTITSAEGNAVLGGVGVQNVTNSGTINGNIALSQGNDNLVNSGTISGDISFTSGLNVVRNAGLIDGEVIFGTGADLYQGVGAGLVSEIVEGRGGNDTLRGGSGADNFDGGDDNDTMLGGGGEDTLLGGNGDDVISGGSGDDIIDGGEDNDTLNGNSGNDNISGGNGTDRLGGGTGDDTLNGGNQNDTLRGGSGNDELSGSNGIDFLFGGNDNDVLMGGGDNDFLRGEAGDDLLQGGAATDDMRGGSGNDTLDGEAGLDRLYGGAGADSFVYNDATDSQIGGIDTIYDFQRGLDLLDFEGFTGDFDFVGTGAHSGGGDASIRFITTAVGVSVRADVDGNGSSDLIITLRNVSTLDADDFIL